MRASRKTAKRARALRREMSPAEARLWLRVRGRVEGRPTVHRQYAFEPYILDFYCPAAGLAIEVDGWMHGEPEQAAHDQRRDRWLTEQGVETLRLPAADLMSDPDGVAERLWDILIERVRMRKASAQSM
jgi:very-short-patch-repair endonuclease